MTTNTLLSNHLQSSLLSSLPCGLFLFRTWLDTTLEYWVFTLNLTRCWVQPQKSKRAVSYSSFRFVMIEGTVSDVGDDVGRQKRACVMSECAARHPWYPGIFACIAALEVRRQATEPIRNLLEASGEDLRILVLQPRRTLLGIYTHDAPRQGTRCWISSWAKRKYNINDVIFFVFILGRRILLSTIGRIPTSGVTDPWRKIHDIDDVERFEFLRYEIYYAYERIMEAQPREN